MADPLIALDQGSLRAAVGLGAFARGVEYADRGAVVQATWSEAAHVLLGTVAGGSAQPYVTTVHVAADPAAGTYAFVRSRCSCAVALNCKHAVALALVAGGHAPPEPEPIRAPGPPSWEDPWRDALDPWTPSSPAESRTLAIELTLKRRLPNRWVGGAMQDEPVELWARVVREGKKGWVAGELSWGRLGSLTHRTGFPDDQVRVLHDLHALYRARTGAGYSEHLRYGDDRSIELSAVTSSALMPLLEQAQRIGLRLVHGDPDLGDVPPIPTGDLCVDVTADGEPAAEATLRVVPVLRIDGTYGEVTPVAFLGSGTGALVRPVEDDDLSPTSRPIRLVSLRAPAALALRRMVFAVEPLTVPAAHRDRFVEEYLPQLRRIAEIVSTDGTFSPPEISAPTLVLKAGFGENHALALQWEWLYLIGGQERRLPLNSPDGEGFRDPAAEARLIAVSDPRLGRYGLARADGPGIDSPLEIGGVDTMHFATEWLPRLRERPDLRLEVTGEPANYREAGDSLRIAVSTKALANDGDWYDLGVSITVDGETVPFLDVFVALAQGKSHLLLPGGAYFSLEKPELLALRRLIDEARMLSDKPDAPLRISRYHTALWDELVGIAVATRQAAGWRKHLDALRRLDAVGHTPLPEGLHADLRHYQIEGFEWLAFLWEHRLGGILADDMGLGKTLQSLALLAHARQREPDAPPFLIVAPTSVVSNWAAEAARFTPGLKVATVASSESRARRPGGTPLAQLAEGADVVVTSYALLRIDDQAYQGRAWAGLLLDEAQFVKNRTSKVHRAARLTPAPFKLAITGTPLENSLLELWSLFSITSPGLFPFPDSFKEFYSVPIERNGDAELLAQLRRRIRPLLKRRTKEEVAPELPPKQEQVLAVTLEPRHRKIYDLALARERQKVLRLLNDVDGNRFEILRSLTLLRQLSLHPGLADAEHGEVPSAKIDALLEHLEAVAGTGHRTLVFSQFTGLLDLIQHRLQDAGIDHARLDGSTRHRGEVIDAFKTGTAPVFLISLKAGGFGLNLTEADYCFLMDPWWNPATEMQAIDRTHRIGQARTVHVYRLIAAGTIEERVLALQARKAELFASVLDEGESFGRRLNADDIRGLFT